MEGVFTYSQDKASPSFIKQMMDRKEKLRICSLCKAHNSTVMWSYYAAAHQGVVIGVEVNQFSPEIIETTDVKYSKENVFKGFLASQADVEARKILTKKLSAFKHEKEVRVFAKSDYVPITIREVYLGYKMPDPRRALLTSLIERIDPTIKILRLERSDLDSSVPENAI